jgi:hypothetical protein
MKEKILKQRLSGLFGMFLGGFFLVWFGFGCVKCVLMFANVGILAVISGLPSIFGIWWVISATAILLNRNRLSIRISSNGIELPRGTAFRANVPKLWIHRSNIKCIKIHKSLRCRGIEIVNENGFKTVVQIRRYCEPNDFLAYCKEMDMPC